MEFCEDNYGKWVIAEGDQLVLDYYNWIIRSSIDKICCDCGKKVKLIPELDDCYICAEKKVDAEQTFKYF